MTRKLSYNYNIDLGLGVLFPQLLCNSRCPLDFPKKRFFPPLRRKRQCAKLLLLPGGSPSPGFFEEFLKNFQNFSRIFKNFQNF